MLLYLDWYSSLLVRQPRVYHTVQRFADRCMGRRPLYQHIKPVRYMY
jgi:hypothetical protein